MTSSRRRARHPQASGPPTPLGAFTGEGVILSGAALGIQNNSMPRSGSYLGPSLGCRDPDHIARWMAAMNAGKAKLHCTAIAKATGAPCRKVPLKFADKCSIHCRGAERIEIDQLRLVWLQRKLRRRFFNIRERAALEAQVSKIKRRALRWWWKIDPTLSGSTIALERHDLARAWAWLRDVAKNP